MKYVSMINLKNLIKEFCKQLELASIKYVESDSFKKSEYNQYTAHELLTAINNELDEGKRAVLLCLLNYKLDRRFYMSHKERLHFQEFKGVK